MRLSQSLTAAQDYGRIAQLADPDGNRITLAEPPSRPFKTRPAKCETEDKPRTVWAIRRVWISAFANPADEATPWGKLQPDAIRPCHLPLAAIPGSVLVLDVE